MHLPDGTQVQLVEGQSLMEEQADWNAIRVSQRMWNKMARLQGSAGGADHKQKQQRIGQRLRQRFENRRLWYDLEGVQVQQQPRELVATTELSNDNPKDALRLAQAFFDKFALDRRTLSDEQLVKLHNRLQRVEIGIGVEEHLGAIYAATIALNDCFAYTKREMGLYSDGEFDIDLSDWTPYATRAYNCSPNDLEFTRQEVKGLCECGVAQPTISPWGFPSLIVHRQVKDQDKRRMAVDFRQLNSRTVNDAFPMPDCDWILSLLQRKRYYATLDLKSGFWQVGLTERAQGCCVFVTKEGQYKFLRMAFGLKNAPAYFQRMMGNILGDLVGDCCLVYIDDVVIWGNSAEECLSNVHRVVRQLRAHGVLCNGEKCCLLSTRIELLGHTIESGRIYPQAWKLEPLKGVSPPENIKQVQKILGVLGYFRKFVRHYAERAKPIYDVMRASEKKLGANLTPKQRARIIGRAKVEWTAAAQAAMMALIAHLEDHCWLLQPVRGADYYLYTDYSGYGIGACAMQRDEQGQERPVAMISRSLTDTELGYSPIEGEALALVWAVDRLKHLLLGSKIIVRTDHKPLIYIFKGAGQRAKLLRWSLLLQKYDLEVEYIEGKANILADCASRMPLREWLGLMDDAAFDLASVIPPTNLVMIAYEEWKSEADRKMQSRKCEICCRRSELGGAVLCDKCGRAWHFECLGLGELPEEYWYCQECLAQTSELNERDLTLDGELIAFLVHGKLPGSREAQARVEAAAAFVRWQNGHLEIKRRGEWLIVPAIAQREEVIEERHVLLRHAGTSKLLSSLRAEFWWKHMLDDISRVVRQCDACQKQRASFGSHKTLTPTYKGLAPFQIWSIDSMPNLGGHRGLVIVCVDCFSKWVEIGVTANHSAKEAWDWFYDAVVCRYGVPFVVRSDQGTEYKGEFDAGCKEWGIQNRRASTRYPQANGQAERFVGLIKAALKKFCDSIEVGTEWIPYLGEIAMGLRCTVSRAHGMTPYRVIFGREPSLPSSIYSKDFDLEAALATAHAGTSEDFAEQLAEHMESIRAEVAKKLTLYDSRSKKYFDQQRSEQEVYEFSAGQAVLLKQRKTGGVRMPAQGPYRFLKYLTSAKRTAIIQNPETGNRIECSTAHLLPYYGQLGEIDVAEDEIVGTRPHKKRQRGRPRLKVASD